MMQWIFLAIGFLGGFRIGDWVGRSFCNSKVQSLQKQVEGQITKGTKLVEEIERLQKETVEMRKVVEETYLAHSD